MKQENEDLLNGFEERMRFINIVRRILDYKKPAFIQKMFPDTTKLDTLIVAVLLFIKERTLGNDMLCSMDDIERFLEDVGYELTGIEGIDYHKLARHIVITALQNDSEIKEYSVWHSDTKNYKVVAVRLLDEEKGSYRLTDDMFDFLYRSKEIESEIDYSVTRFKMKEYMKRNNYTEALVQSRELVSRIRNMRLSIDNFIQRSRENIAAITVDEYEDILHRIRSLLDDEYKELVDIQKEAGERSEKLKEASDTGLSAEELMKHKIALTNIIENISTTIEEQRGLINQRGRLSDAYKDIIESSFVLSIHERMDFEQDIMKPLRQSEKILYNAAEFLLFPLVVPSLEKLFSLENFYVEQSAIKAEETEIGLDLQGMEADGRNLEKSRNQRFFSGIQELFKYMKNKSTFQVQQFLESLSDDKRSELCEENALPSIFLELYGLHIIDIESWKENHGIIVVPQGEFNLSWCLSELDDDLLWMKKILIVKRDDIYSFDLKTSVGLHRIEISNLQVEVIHK